PIALIGACALMLALNFSINTLTLLSMVLAIGLVVDDAIVMLENIYRHIEEGASPVDAALKGSREIAFPIVAMTLTLVAVYVPIGFMSGATGRLFTEFAWTLAGAVLVSGFVALTLSPMMCARFLKPPTKRHGAAYRIVERGLDGLTRGYRTALSAIMRARPLALLAGLVVAALGYPLFVSVPSELAPLEDQGIIRMSFSAPEGATIDYTNRYGEQLEPILDAVPEIERRFVVAGFPTVSQGRVFVSLSPWDERERTASDVAAAISPQAASIAGVRAFPILPPSLGQSRNSKQVEIVVGTIAPYEQLDEWVDAIIEKASAYPGLINIDSDLRLNTPQIRVDIVRDKVASLGIDVARLGRTIETLLGGRQVTRYEQDGEQYDVIVQMSDIDRTNPNDLNRIYVKSDDGALIPLSNLVSITETVAPKELNHFNQLRSAEISANLAPGYSLAEGLAVIEEAARSVVPIAAQIDYSGQSREFKSSSAD
ncbi:MAG: efflux RND transporter permease subunit, partial [Alphaproteobacteria bacterium]